MAESLPLNAERIFAVLDAHKVEYLVIGGIAVQVHGHVRMTNDVDLIPEPTPQNLERLAAQILRAGLRVRDGDPFGIRSFRASRTCSAVSHPTSFPPGTRIRNRVFGGISLPYVVATLCL